MLHSPNCNLIKNLGWVSTLKESRINTRCVHVGFRSSLSCITSYTISGMAHFSMKLLYDNVLLKKHCTNKTAWVNWIKKILIEWRNIFNYVDIDQCFLIYEWKLNVLMDKPPATLEKRKSSSYTSITLFYIWIHFCTSIVNTESKREYRQIERERGAQTLNQM